MRINFLSLILLLFIASACTTTVRHSADYRSSFASSNHQALIIPVEAEVYEVDIAGKKTRMYDFEYYLESIIADTIVPVLQKEGFRVKVLSRRALHEQNLTNDASKLRERYKELHDELYKNVAMDVKQALVVDSSIGSIATAVGAKNQGDLLVMVNYLREVKTGGARAADIAMDLFLKTNRSQDLDKVIMVVAIIDARTGKFLWSNIGLYASGALFNAGLEKLPLEEKAVAKSIHHILENIIEPMQKDRESSNK